MTINRPFADCKVADLHLVDAIQSFGVLVAIDATDRIVAVSSNSAELLGQAPRDLLGTDARSTLPKDLDLDDARAMDPLSASGPARLRVRTMTLAGRRIGTAVHRVAGDEADPMVIAEFQELDHDDLGASDVVSAVQRIADALASRDTAEAAASLLLDGVSEIVGFDRALLYRFLPGWHGQVLDERLRGPLEGFKGLRFPESDLPAIARRLYVAKRQRIIADVRASTVPLLGIHDGMRLDLTGSEMRAVHPTHLEYLTNMGVSASFSVSIVVDDRLWGLIACHHATPRTLGFAQRQACELLATVASTRIADLGYAERMRAMTLHSVVRERARFEIEHGGEAQLGPALPRLRNVFGADGALGRLGAFESRDGAVPGGEAEARLRAWLSELPADRPSAVNQVPMQLRDDPELARMASGILHVPLGEDGFITLLRSEQIEQVDWAGRPPDDDEIGSSQPGPRTSFLTWRSETRGQAAPWDDAELEGATALRDMLHEVLEHAELARAATTDPLTGLANRRAFDDALRAAVQEDRRARSGLMLVDLDRFKPVNDRFGHGIGDALLQHVAKRMQTTVRDADVVARIGGDEFAIVLHNVNGERAIAAFAERLVTSIGAAYDLDGHEIVIGASVGVAIAKDGEDPATLFDRTDRALYEAKRSGGGGYAVAEGVDT